MKRRLRSVPTNVEPVAAGEDIPAGSAVGIDSDGEARAIHAELAPFRHAALFAEATRFGAEWMEPSRHRDLTVDAHGHAVGWKAGDLTRQLHDLHIIGGDRPVRLARLEIPRLVGLLLVLDDALAALEHPDDLPSPA